MSIQEQLIAAIIENTLVAREQKAATDRLIELMEAQGQKTDWADPDEAAKIIGIPVTASRTHRRKLRWLARQGFITKYRSGRPPSYYVPELHEVSKMIRAGKIGYIGQV